MKVNFDRETLLQRLKLLASILPKKPIMAAHEQFLFNIEKGVASITSTDGLKQITTSCDTTKCEGNVMFTISGNLLYKTLQLFLDSDVKLVIKDNQVQLKCGKSTYKMPSENGESYPMIPEIKTDFEASFSGAIFNEGLETAKRYTDPDNSVVAQQGVNLHFEDGKMNAYGFRGFEICKVVITPRSVNKWEDILIPSSAVKAIVACISDSDIVDISHDKQRLEVRTGTVSIVALALDCKYPNVETFYKKRPEVSVKYNTLQFLKALERLQPYAKEDSPLLAIDIKTSVTTMTVDNVDYAIDGSEDIDAIATVNCRIGMNVDFMINALESFTNDEFNIFYSDAKQPVYIEPVSIVKDNDKFILLAPMMIN